MRVQCWIVGLVCVLASGSSWAEQPPNRKKDSMSDGEKEALVGFFGALGNVIVAADEQPPDKRNLAVAAFIRSMGKLAQEGVKADGKTNMGVPIQRFFDSLSEIVKVVDQDPDHPPGEVDSPGAVTHLRLALTLCMINDILTYPS